jgi:hypothetical protein
LFTSKARLKTVQCPVMVKKKKKKAGDWWVTPVILATQEAKIRRILV